MSKLEEPAYPISKQELENTGRTAVSYLFWVAWLSGFGGLHRLYNGKVATGILWMCTWGLFGVGQLVDLALIPKMAEERSRQLRNRKHQLGKFDTPALVKNGPPQAPSLTLKILKLAKRNRGRLTVTDCVLETEATFAEVEAQLKELVKSGYAFVTNDVTSGVVVYEIPELES
ncbi:MAG: TM2 domain-containing protein [Phormidesmis sp.]